MDSEASKSNYVGIVTQQLQTRLLLIIELWDCVIVATTKQQSENRIEIDNIKQTDLSVYYTHGKHTMARIIEIIIITIIFLYIVLISANTSNAYNIEMHYQSAGAYIRVGEIAPNKILGDKADKETLIYTMHQVTYALVLYKNYIPHDINVIILTRHVEGVGGYAYVDRMGKNTVAIVPNDSNIIQNLLHEIGHILRFRNDIDIKQYYEYMYGGYNSYLEKYWFTKPREEFAEDYKCFVLGNHDKKTLQKYNHAKFTKYYKNHIKYRWNIYSVCILWYNVIIIQTINNFGKTAENIGKYVTKGNQINIVGRIQTGKYEKDGRTVYTTDIVVEEFNFCDTKKKQKEEESPFGDDENLLF